MLLLESLTFPFVTRFKSNFASFYPYSRCLAEPEEEWDHVVCSIIILPPLPRAPSISVGCTPARIPHLPIQFSLSSSYSSYAELSRLRSFFLSFFLGLVLGVQGFFLESDNQTLCGLSLHSHILWKCLKSHLNFDPISFLDLDLSGCRVPEKL